MAGTWGGQHGDDTVAINSIKFITNALPAVQVYGGPGSQNVNEAFKMNFGIYLAASKDIIFAYVDGRGSGYQGQTMKHHLYHKLGSVEVEDQIVAAKYLRDNYKFINKDAIGIWGWSYGELRSRVPGSLL